MFPTMNSEDLAEDLAKHEVVRSRPARIRLMKPSVTSAAATVLVTALAAAAIGSFGFYAHALLLKYPPVWPDEALFANPALNLIRRKFVSGG